MSSRETYTHKYFRAFSRIGVSTELRLFQMKGDEVFTVRSYDHAEYDGLTAMLSFAKDLGYPPVSPPRITYSAPPSPLGRFRELLRWYFAFFPFKASLWKKSNNGKRVSAWERWEVPSDLSSAELNSRLLLSLDRAAKAHLCHPKKERMWMIPVGLYPSLAEAKTTGNSVSFIDVAIDDQTTTPALSAQIRSYLKMGTHWGTLLTIRPAGLLGVWLFSQFLKTAHLSFRRTGTLTNVGAWSVPDLPEDEWWVFGDGMVAKMNPMVATALMVNGKLGVSVIFDASVGKSEAEARAFLKEWKESFKGLS